MPGDDQTLLSRIASRLTQSAAADDADVPNSILTSTANLYGARRAGTTQGEGTSFDPEAAALFEAVVEAAFLVAKADGVFDPTEQLAFQQVVLTACEEAIPESQMAAILADLARQLEEDGMDKRLRMVARTIATAEHAREVLRVGALIAHISEGVSDVERDVMVKLAREFQLGPEVVDEAISEVEAALAQHA
jgi:tellurite resistance protein